MTNFWRRGLTALRASNPTERMVAHYLVEGPQANRVGIYYLGGATMGEDVGVTLADAVFQSTLVRWGFRFDSATQVVWIPQWWVWRPEGTLSAFKSALKDVKYVPNTPLLELWGEYHAGLPDAWVPYLRAASRGQRVTASKVRVVQSQSDLLGERHEAVLLSSLVQAEIVALWNAAAVAPILPVKRIGKATQRHVAARLEEYPSLADWAAVFREVNRTPYCRGESEKYPNFFADLAYVVRKGETFERFIMQAQRAPVPKARARVRNCQHVPPCSNEAACTELKLQELGG